MGKLKEEPVSPAELEWIRVRKEVFGEEPVPAQSKFMEKFKSNPFVPFGTLLTCAALGYGLYTFKAGKSRNAQFAMRARVAAQGFTIVALLAGIMLGANASTNH